MLDAPGAPLARNAALNVAAQLAGMAAPVIAIPIALHALGVERFGILALCWLILGAFTTFDLGIGRATVHLTARAVAARERGRAAEIVAGSYAAQLALGTAAGIGLAVASTALVPVWAGIPLPLREEAADTLLVLSIGVPASLALAAGRAVLEGTQRFGVVNAVAGPLSVLTYAVAAGAAALGLPLPAIAALLVAVRLVGAGAYVGVVARSGIAALVRPSASVIRDLLGYGSWIAVGSVTGPLVVYADRLVVSAILGVAALGRYSPPFDALTRLWVVPAGIAVALFPYLTGANPRTDARARHGYWSALTAVLLVMVAPVIALITVGADLLTVWLGQDFARETAALVPIIAVGVLTGALGYVPVALLQATGRPDVSVKLQLAELIPFVGATWLLVGAFGLAGAALAWTMRATVDLAATSIAAERIVPELVRVDARRRFLEHAAAASALAAVALVASAALPSIAQRSAATAIALAVVAVMLVRSWPAFRDVTAQ